MKNNIITQQLWYNPDQNNYKLIKQIKKPNTENINEDEQRNQEVI